MFHKVFILSHRQRQFKQIKSFPPQNCIAILQHPKLVSYAECFLFNASQILLEKVFVARVAGMENTDNQAKAGVMMRESLANNAKYADMVVTPGSGVSFQYRTDAGGSSGLATVNNSASC
jgi:hypothetical protein